MPPPFTRVKDVVAHESLENLFLRRAAEVASMETYEIKETCRLTGVSTQFFYQFKCFVLFFTFPQTDKFPLR